MISIDLEEMGVTQGALEVDLSYDFYPGEPMVRYYSDGSGYPGSPPHIDLTGVHVRSWTVAGEKRQRDGHWVWETLDELALVFVEDNWEYFADLCMDHEEAKD